MIIRRVRSTLAVVVGLAIAFSSITGSPASATSGGGTIQNDDSSLVQVSLDVDGNGGFDALTDGLLILRFRWKPTRNLTSQSITIFKTHSSGGSPTPCFTTTQSPTSNSYSVSRTKLASCGKEIFFRVSGKPTKGKSSEQNSAKISTLPPPSAINVTISSSSQNSVLVTWSSLPGTTTVSSFTVKLSNGSTKEVSSTTHSVNFTGLKVGEIISASVHANIHGVISLLKEISGKKVVTVGAKPPTLVISHLISFTCPEGAKTVENGCMSPEISSAALSQYFYTCPSGTNVSGSTCVSGGTVPAIGAPSYLCSQGTLVGTHCVSAAISTAASATTVYTCPVGTTLIGHNCSSSTTPAAVSYSCAQGFTLSGSYCTSTSTTAASGSAFFGYSCSSGGVLTSTLSGWICTSTNSYNATATYSCPTGGVVSGSVCATNSSVAATSTTNYSCSNGGTLNGTSCVGTSSISANITYSCNQGNVLSGSTCGSTSTYSASGNSLSGYTCPQGGSLTNSGLGATCTVTTNFAATATSNCPSGYSLNGSSCLIATSSPATATITYSCPSGSTLNGTTCLNNTVPASASTLYSCAYGTSLSGSTCITASITTNATPTTIYSCPSGAVVSGANCVTPISTTQATATITYVCTSGSLVGTNCVSPSVSIDPLTLTRISTLTTTNASSVTENHIAYQSPFDTTVCATPYEIQVTGIGGQIDQQLFCLRTH